VTLQEENPQGVLPGLEHAVKSEFDSTDQVLKPHTFRFPACQISASTKRLVDQAYELMVEATQSSPYIAAQLLYAVRMMFELYLDVVPIYHKERLEILPQQAAIFHTNCMYIAHHLMTLGHQFKSQLPEAMNGGLVTFVDIAVLMRHKGSEQFLGEMREQKKQLLDTLREAGAFQYVAESTAYLVAAETAVKRCLLRLQHLQTVWREVLPSNVYCSALGTLLNTCVDEVITRVIQLEDIPEPSAVHLLAIFGIITDRAPSLFEDPNTEATPAVHRYVKRWSRFKELMLVLGSSMVDILDRWADGKGPLAHEFTVDQLKHLIRALFQNTERRAQVLAKIV